MAGLLPADRIVADIVSKHRQHLYQSVFTTQLGR